MPDENKQPDDKRRLPTSPVHDESPFAVLLDTDRFAQLWRAGQMFSESELVPEIFQGKPANCAVALQMAFRLQVDPMMLMQNMYIVHGRPGIEAKLAIALINSRGPFTGPLQWKEEGQGDARSWTCYATHRTTGEQCRMTVDWKMVQAEGWDKPKGQNKVPSKWSSIPEIMGKYRSAMFLGRLYCPEVLLGLPTKEELEDTLIERVVTGERLDAAADLMPRPKAPVPPGFVGAAGKAIEQAKPGTLDLGTPVKEPQPVETVRSAPAPAVDVTAQAQTAEAAASQPQGPAPVRPASVDTETGELAFPGDGAGAPPPTAQRPPEPDGAAVLAQAIASDPMAGKRIASKAQRDMIAGIAEKHCGIAGDELDAKLADRFACTLATMPMVLVNDAIGFVRTLRPGAQT